MTHLSEEQFTQAYYGEDSEARQHIESCPECRLGFEQLKTFLDSLPSVPIPERDDSYGSELWARLAPQLSQEKRQFVRARWVLVPALATLIAVAFLAGVFVEQRQAEHSAQARERVLLFSISNYLESSQILLSELAHADANGANLGDAREQARDLLNESYLLRESAAHLGSSSDTGLLDELERVLLSIANSPGTGSGEFQTIQQRIEDQDLIFKARIAGIDAREKGQRL